MLLFKQLINNDDTETTVITDSQIFEILNKEFGMNISGMHKLELDIYLNVMKKFLTEWPKWGQFDRVVHRLMSPEYSRLLQSTLEDKYKLLKSYLNKQLNLTKPLAQQAVEELTQSTSSSVKENNDPEDVILELFCSRDQLNQLFYRHPKGDSSKNIFNVTNLIQNKIIINTWDIASICNMWNVRISINLNSFIYKREMIHKLSQVLVNKKRKTNQPTVTLDTRLQEKCNKWREYDINKILTFLSDILRIYENNIGIYEVLFHVFAVIESDLNNAMDSLKVPVKYRQYLNRYPYVRYLYANDNGPNSSNVESKYDLQLQETVSPMVQYFIAKVDKLETTVPPFLEWFKIECGMCKVQFKGDDLTKELKVHFNDHHHNEPDWECTNCKLKFDVKKLTEARWRHDCS